MGKIRAVLEALPDSVRRRVARWADEVFGGPLTEAERSKRHREASRVVVTEDRHENVTVHRDATTENRTKVLSSSGYLPGFLQFWSLYPKRVGKGEAYRSWQKQELETRTQEILEAVGKQNGYLIRERGKFTPLAATWLNQQRWEDEPFHPAPLVPKGNSHGKAEALLRTLGVRK